MDRFDTDPLYTPAPVLLARPLIARFVLAPECPVEHRWHARTTLPVLALFVAMCAEPTSRGLDWGALDADELLRASIGCEDEELGFLRDLLDVSASFYAFLAREGLLPSARARELRARLARLALGVARP